MKSYAKFYWAKLCCTVFVRIVIITFSALKLSILSFIVLCDAFIARHVANFTIMKYFFKIIFFSCFLKMLHNWRVVMVCEIVRQALLSKILLYSHCWDSNHHIWSIERDYSIICNNLWCSHRETCCKFDNYETFFSKWSFFLVFQKCYIIDVSCCCMKSCVMFYWAKLCWTVLVGTVIITFNSLKVSILTFVTMCDAFIARYVANFIIIKHFFKIIVFSCFLKMLHNWRLVMVCEIVRQATLSKNMLYNYCWDNNHHL